MRHRFVWLAAAVAAVATVAIVGGSVGTQRASAATTLPACATGSLVPELGAVTINQGLGSYANQKLVRGKETLVRFFLKLPGIVGTQCSGSINVVNTTTNPTEMTLINGATDLPGRIGPYQVYPSTGLQITSSTVSVNSNADPTFVVPASRVNPCDSTPCATTGLFSRNFRAKISYIRNGVTSTVFNATFSSPMTGNFDQVSNDLRLLVIPMGDRNLSYSSQFGTAAQQAVQSGMDTLSRLLPVRAGVSSDLASTTGGIRYKLDLAAMLNLRAVPGAYDANNRFCGSQANFDAIKGQLAQYLQAYNSNLANAAHPADRVLGVVDSAISDGSTSSFNCAEGMASTSSTEAWVRAIPDQPASGRNPAVPSMTGSLMAMELLHTFGQELVSSNIVHSSAIQADGTAPDRGYHLTSRSYIAKDLTVLNFVNTSTAPWNNNTTLLEFNAFERALCNLGGSLTSNCTLPAKVGSPPAAAGTGHFVISATTNGTAGGTEVTNSYFTRDPVLDTPNSVLETPCLTTASTYKLRFFTSAGTVDCNVPASALTSEHDAATQVNTTTALITGAFPSPGGETKAELRKGATVLHTVNVLQDPPELLSLSNLAPGGGITQTKTITTPEILPTPDIYFLADTTGSMGGALANVQANASDILDTVKAEAADPRFGAGDYKDFTSCGDPEFAPCFSGDYAFNNPAPIPASDDSGTAALDAIAGWSATGGGDQPEGQLFALDQLSSPSTAGWRSDSSRILVWFGDNPGHDPVCAAIRGPGAEGDITKGTVTDALAGADLRVIAVTLDTDSDPEFDFSSGLNGDPAAVPGAPGDYAGACGSGFATDSANQATAFAEATGGVVKTAASAEEVSAEILAGLRNLPATATPEATCDEGLTISFDPESKTVTSGDDVTFTERADIDDGATPGETLTCEITFLINGMVVTLDDGETPDPAFQQTISLTVEGTSSTTTTVMTTDTDPKAEIFVSCDGSQLPSHVGVPGTEVQENIWQFNTNADTTNTCAEAGDTSKITVFVSDGANQVAGAVGETGTTVEDDRERPTASIYAPAPNYVNPETQPFALNGQVFDPDDGPLTPSWTITGPVGSGIFLTATGNSADVRPSSGVWALGDYTVTISGTDSDGNPASASVTVHVRRYVFSGFLSPIRPLPTLNDGKIKSTIPVKWQLRDQAGNFITDLGVVAAIRVSSAPCPVVQNTCDTTPTGGTLLRYDTAMNQYVYNWQTPSQVGTYVLSVHFTDGTTYAAYFKLTK
jgi:hypothetical protein